MVEQGWQSLFCSSTDVLQCALQAVDMLPCMCSASYIMLFSVVMTAYLAGMHCNCSNGFLCRMKAKLLQHLPHTQAVRALLQQ